MIKKIQSIELGVCLSFNSTETSCIRDENESSFGKLWLLPIVAMHLLFSPNNRNVLYLLAIITTQLYFFPIITMYIDMDNVFYLLHVEKMLVKKM